MKKTLFMFLSGITLLLSCTGDRKELIEGSWELIYFKWTYTDSTFDEYPGNIKTCMGKWILSDANALFYYKYKANDDTTYSFEFGDMKYSYDGNIYQETYINNLQDKLIGQTFHYKITIINDTLTLSGPVDKEVEILGCKVHEKFVRGK